MCLFSSVDVQALAHCCSWKWSFGRSTLRSEQCPRLQASTGLHARRPLRASIPGKVDRQAHRQATIIMLAFSPGIPSGYNVALTLLSLIAAIVLTGIGLAVALSRTLPGASWLGGAIVGGGIAAMHYTGMAAFEIQGRIIWDPVLVIVSIAAGALIGSAATRVGLIDGEPKWKYYGAVLLDRRHLQPSFHGDGRGLDHARSQDRRVRNRDPDRLAGHRGGARQPGDPAARLLRPCARHSRPAAAGTGEGPHARPRQCRRRRACRVRRRDDRDSKPQFCRPHRRPRGTGRGILCHPSCPTNRCERDCSVIQAK